MSSDSTRVQEEINRSPTAIGASGAQSIILLTAAMPMQLLTLGLSYVAGPSTGGLSAASLVIADSGGDPLFQIPVGTVAAGATGVISFGAGLPLQTGSSPQTAPLPFNMYVPPGGTVALKGTIGLATDTLAASGMFSYF